MAVVPGMLVALIFFSSCTITRKAPKDRPYLGRNTIEVTGGNFTKTEKSALLQRLANQMDDSAKTTTKDALFLLHLINKPPAYDTGYSGLSARNMNASMFHLGYYSSRVEYKADTIDGRRVNVKYSVFPGRQTLIDTVSYRLVKPDLQQMALAMKSESILVENNPITKAAVLGEMSRLVDSFRNNGYYKFTSAELKVRGDTTIAALTSVTDDPFEQLRLLAEAQQKRDSPQIKLAVVLNIPEDSTKLNKYTINKIYVLEDFRLSDRLTDTTGIIQRELNSGTFVLRYHQRYVRTAFLTRNITLRRGDVFRQSEYYSTLTNLSKAGIWENVNIQIIELPDSNKVDLVIELLPGKKFGFEAALEASYSASNGTSNALAGNLFGLSGNLSLVNRNIGREAIRMTHSFRAGVELNNNSRNNANRLVNSNELSYRNTLVFPRLITPWNKFVKGKLIVAESFVNTSLSYNNRLNLFNLQNINLTHGFSFIKKKERRWTFRPLNAEFSYLFNQSDSFKNVILVRNPFLKYSYNTAFIFGTGASYASTYRNPKHLLSLNKERTVKLNAEESGLTWGALPILRKYKKKFIKLDAEYKYTVNFVKTGLAFRVFAGVGIPLGKDTALPFFKQYFGGGSNSMRGWPVRGIGRGGQKQVPFGQNIFNDRTGDLQLEGNMEYRYDIARIIPNSLTLRGAVFVDAGNIWNMKNGNPTGGPDSAQFQIKNLYKQLGLSAGTGFRLDFNYFILRLDLGFRFKRPELSYENAGWKAPPIGFDDFIKKLFSKGANDQYRKWRYENFNFTIGISYPF
ncbi:MAG: BamA/TamA family outer membrane protein [Ferruginibacter sp.]|nr:BamA/TamA family outer membrane protein [Ferruginibacter sp.]